MCNMHKIIINLLLILTHEAAGKHLRLITRDEGHPLHKWSWLLDLEVNREASQMIDCRISKEVSGIPIM